jgi:hypothetical protein
VLAAEVKMLVAPVCKTFISDMFTTGTSTVKVSVTVILKESLVASVLVNVNVGVNVAIFSSFYKLILRC